MEVEEVEAVLDKIWDLHDKLSDAIHSISRTHFLNTVKTLSKKSGDKTTAKQHQYQQGSEPESRTSGCVFVKDFAAYDEAIQEAKSLNSIRTALENLEDQLEFFHTVQIQQRAERDAAIARLEQSRIVLAMRLAEHHGKKYKVVEEALAFVGDVQEASRFIFPEYLYSTANGAGENLANQKGNILMKFLVSSFNFAKGFLRLDQAGGVLGNAALVAITMMALLNFNQVTQKDHIHKHRVDIYGGNGSKRSLTRLHKSSNGSSGQLDVLLARG
ncbi:hypothetical protein CRG98_027535 [Punica granatum]|nr:hypothetical protein CRG98_027535 [Punica granatum]